MAIKASARRVSEKPPVPYTGYSGSKSKKDHYGTSASNADYGLTNAYTRNSVMRSGTGPKLKEESSRNKLIPIINRPDSIPFAAIKSQVNLSKINSGNLISKSRPPMSQRRDENQRIRTGGFQRIGSMTISKNGN